MTLFTGVCGIRRLLFTSCVWLVNRTATVYKTLDPLWGEEFILHMHSGFQNLSLYVYDADKVR